MNPLRTAILGCGNFAQRHAANIVQMPDELQLVAFADHCEENARAFADRYTAGAAATYTDFHAMLDRERLDLLLVALPPFAHSDEVEAAAAHGVHLLVEKPIALTAEHAWRMVAAAEAAGIKTQVGFMFRFGAAVEHMKGLIESGEAGRAGLMSARYFCNSLHAPWWRDRSKSGGQLVEQVIHMIDLMRYLLGEPAAVFSRQENLFHTEMADYTVEDVSATVVSFRSGALGVIYATNGAIPLRWINDYHVVAQKVTADFANANNAVFHFTAQPSTPPLTVAEERNVHVAELRDLIRAIRTGGATRTPLREGALSLDLALAAAASSAERREIPL
jgi:predicted dehydrogenase